MLTIIAEIRTHAATEHRQVVLDAFQKITPTVLAEDGCYDYETLIDHLPTLEMQTQDQNLIVMLENGKAPHILKRICKLHICSDILN